MSQATMNDAGVFATLRGAVDNATAGRVFGTPIVQDGMTVVPVAKIRGGAGGGSGPEGGKEGGGTGGGFGLTARPVGVFVLKDGRVDWHPAIDVTRIVLGGQLVAVAALLVIRSLIRARAR